MITQIDERGELSIKAETPIESYALKTWFDNYHDDDRKGTTSESLRIITIEEENKAKN